MDPNLTEIFSFSVEPPNCGYNINTRIDRFSVVCLVAWPLNESEAGVDLVLIKTSLLFLCKLLLISVRTASLTREKQSGFY